MQPKCRTRQAAITTRYGSKLELVLFSFVSWLRPSFPILTFLFLNGKHPGGSEGEVANLCTVTDPRRAQDLLSDRSTSEGMVSAVILPKL